MTPFDAFATQDIKPINIEKLQHCDSPDLFESIAHVWPFHGFAGGRNLDHQRVNVPGP